MNVDNTRLLEDVQALVRIPSIESLDAVAEYTLGQLREAGVDNAKLDEEGNVVGSLGEGDGLLLNAHLDTVGVQGYLGDPFSGDVEGESVVGRGSCDCKSGVAGMLEIARQLADKPLHRRVILTASVWEEGMTDNVNGAYGLARREGATEAIVMEQTVRSPEEMAVQVGCLGTFRMNLRVKGKACHSSRPQEGDNAIYRAAEFARRFQEAFPPDSMPHAEFEVCGETLSSQSVISLTEIEAMQGRNIIPDGCFLGLDCRINPGQDWKAVERRVRDLAGEFGEGMIEVEKVVAVPGHFCDREPLIETCRAAAKASGFGAPLAIMTGRADSTIFQNEGGVPSVVFGPGNANRAHTNNERLDLPLFYLGAQACLDAVWALAGKP